MAYNKRKFIEALLFFAKNTDPQKYGVLKAVKLLYFSDLLHLKEYQRTITGDEYSRIDHGPIPKKSYTALREMYASLPENRKPDSDLQAAITILPRATQRGVTQLRIRAKRPYREEEFSESDLEVMQKVAEIYKDATADSMEKSSYEWTEKNLEIDLRKLLIEDTIPQKNILSTEERRFVEDMEREADAFSKSLGLPVNL